MKTQLQTVRRLIEEGSPEEMRRALDLLKDLTANKPLYRNQLTVLRSDLSAWEDSYIRDTGATKTQYNRIVDKVLRLVRSLEEGRTDPTVTRGMRFLMEARTVAAAFFRGVEHFLDNKVAGFFVLVALWFLGGYLLGWAFASSENGEMSLDEFYLRSAYNKMAGSVYSEAQSPDGVVSYRCKDEFNWNCHLASGEWEEVPTGQFVTIERNVVPIVIAAGGVGIPVGYQAFRQYFLSSVGNGKANWRYVVYGVVFGSGIGYGYYSHRRKIPACDDPELIRRFRDPLFQARLHKLLKNGVENQQNNGLQ